MNVSAVIKRKGKWLIGFITSDGKFRKKSEIKKLADVKEVANYMTLKRFLKEKSKGKVPDGFEKKCLKKMKAETCYILDKPIELTPEEWEQYWWEEIHPWCKICDYECKQSFHVVIQSCKFSMEKGKF
jgi:hypothetical protein